MAASAPLHPLARQRTVELTGHDRVARDTYQIRWTDSEMARVIRPGQFVMIRMPDRTDPLLGRAFALYDTDRGPAAQPAGIRVVFAVVGKMTGLLARARPGDRLEVWGPLGNGFSACQVEHLMMVGGGIGQTPLLALARWALGRGRYGPDHDSAARPRARRVSLCYGARSADLLAGVDDFAAAGVDVRLATDDGSRGHHGYVTDLVAEALAGPDWPERLVGCGPVPMLTRLAALAAEAGIPCELSLETPMACGFGACFSCVVRLRLDDGTDDWRRCCTEGPVFDARRVIF